MATTRRPTEERRAQIADAALRIISTQGVQKLTTQALGREVGITDGSIFRHFKDKAEIVRAAIERVEGALFENFPPRDEDPLDRLGAFFRQRLELVQRTPTAFLAAFSERLEEAAGEEAGLVRSMIERSQRFVRQCLVEAQSAGRVPEGLNVDTLVLVVVGTLQAAAFTQRKQGARARVDPAQAWRTLEALLSPGGRAKPR